MSSTSNSNSASRSLVVADNLHLAFDLQLRPEATLRGQFVKFMRAPAETLLRTPEKLHILNGINFKVEHGDRIAILGKNGAGKSTLCRCLTGIYRPSRGSLSVFGQVRSIIDPSAVIYPELTGRENARIMIALMYPELMDRTEDLLEEALEFSGLKHFLDTPFRHYSNGMQTRLCLSIATCAPSDIFVLDEVFEGADAEFRERISQRILNLIASSGAVFFVSHAEEQVKRVCNKAMLIHQGKLLGFGPVDHVVNSYKEILYESQF